MSKRNTKDHPLTKGGALIQAREMLGPAATVRTGFGICEVLSNGESWAKGTWEQALEAAQGSDKAKTWQQFKADRENELTAARFSLLAKAKEFLKDSKLMHLLSRSEKKYVVGSLRAR